MTDDILADLPFGCASEPRMQRVVGGIGGIAVTEPVQVSVNVADLRALDGLFTDQFFTDQLTMEQREAVINLCSAIPELEWEPTDDQIEQYMRAHQFEADAASAHRGFVSARLRAMHREGLL